MALERLYGVPFTPFLEKRKVEGGRGSVVYLPESRSFCTCLFQGLTIVDFRIVIVVYLQHVHFIKGTLRNRTMGFPKVTVQVPTGSFSRRVDKRRVGPVPEKNTLDRSRDLTVTYTPPVFILDLFL